jgi:hypothetical protein
MDVAKHKILKWRSNSRWTLKRFYRLKLVNIIIFKNFFKIVYLFEFKYGGALEMCFF